MFLENAAYRRWGALFIFLATIALPVIGLLIWSVDLTVDYGRRLYAMTELLDQYRALVSEAPFRKQAIIAMRLELSKTHAFYEENTSQAASAEMAQALKELVQVSGGELRSISINPALRSGELEKIQVDFDASVPSASLARLLSLLQRARPFLVVISMTVNAAQFGTISGQLWVTMKVSAFRTVRRGAI